MNTAASMSPQIEGVRSRRASGGPRMGVGRHDRSISPTRMGVGEKGHDEFFFVGLLIV